MVMAYKTIRIALAAEKATNITQQDYNTSRHTRAEIESALPDMEHVDPADLPYILFSNYIDVVMASRSWDPSYIYRIELDKSVCRLLDMTSNFALFTGQIPLANADALHESFPADFGSVDIIDRFDTIDELLQEHPIFPRLDECSLRDAITGEGPLENVKDLWTRLVTSRRAMYSVKYLQKINYPVYLHLLPWDDEMKPELEYRAFVSPGSHRIVAISQYKWQAKWYHAKEKPKVRDNIVGLIMEGSNEILAEIFNCKGLTNRVKEHGFVFDVVENPVNHRLRLVDINEYGAMTATGACLFHWIVDAKILYGLEDKIQFRVTR